MSEAEGRSKRKRRRQGAGPVQARGEHPSMKGSIGGRYQPLNLEDLPMIDRAVRSILSDVGMAEAPDSVIDQVTAANGNLDSDGRLHFPAELIESALAGFQRNYALCGQHPDHDMQLAVAKVHAGSGGAAPLILDMDSEEYRESTLRDLYDAARLVDSLDNIHFFSRSMVARDMPDNRSMDINTAYACLVGTRKHVFAAATEAAHVEEIANMCYAVAGSREAFLARPFLSMNCNMSVPPLRFDAESCEIGAEAVRFGIPLHSNTFGQMGASSPVTLAGSIAQTIAESLAGMIFAWLLDPEAKLILGTRPMLTDLRTGAMSGGSAEGAIATAACVQMSNYYKLPNSIIAGATDSKVPDAQSGYEKCLTVTLAAQSGCNLITQASGMQASLMGCALESYVIDNDMLGVIMKSLAGIDVNEQTLALNAIDEVAHGEGHFLGQAETLGRMQTDFIYPEIGDRRSIEEWKTDGSKNIHQVAIERTKKILGEHFPRHFSDELDQELRAKFDIRLPHSMMGKM
ncbi:MAG: trimethylamine--corrinoid protein Co-methyltransferase [Gammaproteobacteria bacterium]|jgi:trimethylamine--corrinoid protein Co-methyltransferase